jgi:hypothetical protein
LIVQRGFNPRLDLTGVTHLRIALRASNPQPHHNFQIKLVDDAGRMDWLVAESSVDVPAWRVILGLVGRIPDAPDVVTYGLEGNISAYSGLLAARRTTEARALGTAIFNRGWFMSCIDRRLAVVVSGALEHRQASHASDVPWTGDDTAAPAAADSRLALKH